MVEVLHAQKKNVTVTTSVTKSDVITPKEVATISKELDVPMIASTEQNDDSDSSIGISDDEPLVFEDSDGENLFLNKRNQFDDYSSDDEIVPSTSVRP